MMSHAQSSWSSCLHMGVPLQTYYSSTSSTPQTTLPINESLFHSQNEECCSVANTTSSRNRAMSPVKTSHTGSLELPNQKKLQTAKEDEWNTTRSLLRDVTSLPKSSWQAFGESNAPPWSHIRTPESPIFLGTMERTTVTENPCPQFGASETVWQFPKRVTLPYPHEEILSGY